MGVSSLDRYPVLDKLEGSEGYGLAYGYLLELRLRSASGFGRSTLLQNSLIVSRLPDRHTARHRSRLLGMLKQLQSVELTFKLQVMSVSASTATALYHLVVREDHPQCMLQQAALL